MRFFDADQGSCLVMEYVRGWTLTELIDVCGALPTGLTLALFRQALDAVGYAHRQNVIHRDIKPGNFILSQDGVLKTMDFGIARVLGSARMTRTGNLIGTLEYMSPEQIQGQEVDARADIYSLGILCYELLTGRTPFEAVSEYALMRAQVEQNPPPPRELVPEITTEVEQLLLRALAKDPDQRFQSAAEFSAALSVVDTADGTSDDTLTALLATLSERRPLPPLPTLPSRLPPTRLADAAVPGVVAPASTTAQNEPQDAATASPDRRRRWPYAAAAVGAVALLAGAGAVLVQRPLLTSAPAPLPAEPARAEPVRAEPVQVDLAQIDLVRAEPVQAEPVRTRSVQTEPVQTEPVQTEPVQTEPVLATPLVDEPIQAEPVQVEERPAERPEDASTERWATFPTPPEYANPVQEPPPVVDGEPPQPTPIAKTSPPLFDTEALEKPLPQAPPWLPPSAPLPETTPQAAGEVETLLANARRAFDSKSC